MKKNTVLIVCATLAVITLIGYSGENNLGENGLFPECKSRTALSDVKSALKNSSQFTRVIDMTDVFEMPVNFKGNLASYFLRGKIETKPLFQKDKRVCVANAITNKGDKKISYTFEIVDGINTSSGYLVTVDELLKEEFHLLKSDKFRNAITNYSETTNQDSE